jgi:phage minor structural protein
MASVSRVSVVIYDKSMRKLAYLQNATNVRVTQVLNEVWEASFRLPADDEKAEYCKEYHFAEIYDNEKRVDVFRIMNSKIVVTDVNYYKEYICEHVLGTLLDDVIYGFVRTKDMHSTTEAIQTVLDYQSVKNWVLPFNGVDIDRRFTYEFENINLLSALFSIPETFDGEEAQFMWTWDTTLYPWTLNLVKLATNERAKCEIRYKKNMAKITKIRDPRPIATRIYPLGYGDGDNQLTIKSVNPTGKEYIDASTITEYGVIAKIWVDRRYKDATNLYNAALAALEDLKVPKVTYEVSAADLKAITGVDSDSFQLGDVVRIYDPDINVDVTNRIVEIERPDIVNRVEEVDIKITNVTDSLVDQISQISDRQRITDVNSQGVTSFSNFTLPQTLIQGGFPVNWPVWFPDENTNYVRMNKAYLRIRGRAYRVYQRNPGEDGSGLGYLSMDVMKDRQFDYNSAYNKALTTQWQEIFRGYEIFSKTLFAMVELTISPESMPNVNETVYIRVLVQNEKAEKKNVYFPDEGGADYECQLQSMDHTHTVSTSHSHSASGSGGGSCGSGGDHSHSISLSGHSHAIGVPVVSHTHIYGTPKYTVGNHAHTITGGTTGSSGGFVLPAQSATTGGPSSGAFYGSTGTSAPSGSCGSAGGHGHSVSVSVSVSVGSGGGTATTSGPQGVSPIKSVVKGIIMIPSELQGKRLIFQAKASSNCRMSITAKSTIFPLPTKDIVPGMAEPKDPVTGKKYYPEDVELWAKKDGDWVKIADKTTQDSLKGGWDFDSQPIEITEYVEPGHNDFEIRCKDGTRGMIMADGHILFFISTVGVSG